MYVKKCFFLCGKKTDVKIKKKMCDLEGLLSTSLAYGTAINAFLLTAWHFHMNGVFQSPLFP